MVLGPAGPDTNGTPVAARPESSVVASSATDRRPLFQPRTGGLYRPAAQQMVAAAGQSGSGGNSRYLDRGWSGPNTEDLLTIRRLKVENWRLNNILRQYQRANELMRAQLDTSGVHTLDLQHDQ